MSRNHVEVPTLLSRQQLDFEDEGAVGHDPPGREALLPVGIVRAAGQSCDLSDSLCTL